MSNMAGLGGPISGALGAAAGVAAGNSASKGAGQFGGGLVGGAFFGPFGSMIGAYVGGKFGSGEWGFEGKGQFDPFAPDNMGRVGSGPNATPVGPGLTQDPVTIDPPSPIGPGLAVPAPPDVTVEPLAAPWQDPDLDPDRAPDAAPWQDPDQAPDAPAWNDPDAPSNDDGGGGGGSGGGCVVCTTLHDHRLVEPIIYRAIMAYGALVNDTTMRGYHWWGKPLARFLDRSALARWVISPLARPVVRELAFRGGIGKSTWIGRRLLGLGEVACAAVATLLTPKQGSCENCKCRLN